MMRPLIMNPKTYFIEKSLLSAAVIVIGGLAGGNARAADGTWIKVDGNGSWNATTTATWQSGIIPGAVSGTTNTDIAYFTQTTTGTATRISNVDPYRNVGGVTFGGNNTNFGYALNGGSTGNLILSAGGVIQVDNTATGGTHTDTVNVTVTLVGDATITNNATGSNRSLKIQTVNGSATAGNTSVLTINGSNGSNGNVITQPTSGQSIGDGANGGKLAVTKSGTGKWTLSGTNTYTGDTTVSAGVLVIGTAGSLANTAVTVGGATATGTPTLGGGGTIAGATTIAAAGGGGVVGTHAVGVAGVSNAVGTQTFSNTLTYGTGSIFEWDLQAASATDPGHGASDVATGTYDKVVASGLSGSVTGGSAIFKIVLGGNSFADEFWNTNKSWTDIFTGAGAPVDLTAVFSTFGGSVASSGIVADRGQFSFNGTSTLTWSAVPEPTSALAGLLLGAGLLRRRRRA